MLDVVHQNSKVLPAMIVLLALVAMGEPGFEFILNDGLIHSVQLAQ
jgi:hypothetical protein